MFGSYLPLNGIVDLVTFVWYFSVLFFERDKEKWEFRAIERLFSKPCETMRVTMTFASECYKLVVVNKMNTPAASRWKTGQLPNALLLLLFLPIWDTPPSHDNHSASTKDGFSIDFRTYRDLLFH
ncbi:hypothetical protein ACJX0J_003970 (mitochondrion) [Zea mays]